MQIINFKPEFYKSVRSNKKTSTIRTGHRPYSCEKCTLAFSTTTFLKARINRVEHTYFYELREEDAIKDGFENLKELTDTLTRIYGEMKPSDPVTIIDFELV